MHLCDGGFYEAEAATRQRQGLYQNIMRALICMPRPPPPELITPKVAWVAMLVPGLPQETELVKLLASQRIWSLYCSHSRMSLASARLRPQAAGPRKPDLYGGGQVLQRAQPLARRLPGPQVADPAGAPPKTRGQTNPSHRQTPSLSKIARCSCGAGPAPISANLTPLARGGAGPRPALLTAELKWAFFHSAS